MAFTFLSHSLRQILPRVEIRERDRRPGAYPVKSKTGDRTRTGRNKLYFDDGRTVLYLTGVNITYPTTQQFDSNWVGEDLTGTLGNVVGNVDPYAVDQFIVPAQQVERAGPFFDTDLYEQDETNVVNSQFMTGAAFSISPDRFKSKISNKTILRFEIPLTQVSQLTPSSSILYLDPSQGKFSKNFDNEKSLNINAGSYPSTFAPLPFTPYGLSYLPLNDTAAYGFGASAASIDAKSAYKRITSYQGDGSDGNFYTDGVVYGYVTSSLLNPIHRAEVTQSVSLRNYLGHAFLLEKAVVEFPFAAGPEWLNDRFGIREILQDDLTYTIDAGGPLISLGLMRQDKSDARNRDLIASGSITTLLDMTTGSYQICSSTYIGAGGYTDVCVTPEGIGWFANPTVVVTGSTLSGSGNFYTGSIKMILEPQVTSHVWRMRVSGSAIFYYNVGTANGGPTRSTQATGLAFGSITRRSVKQMESGRSVLGNHFALIKENNLDGTQNPVKIMDSQFEDLSQDNVAPRFFKSKIYHDVISETIKSPYLLYPDDELIFCLSKHRAVGSPDPLDWDLLNAFPTPNRLVAYHDVSIPVGTLKITLYGDLIKEEREFHDTLNQRLETEEIWQDVGEDPVLDQFDVAYRSELSGSYIDRFNVLNALASYNTTNLSSSIELTSFYSHFSSKIDEQKSWSTQYGWSTARSIETLKKNNRNVNHASLNEKFWDSRIPDPLECIKACNSNYRLFGLDTVLGNTISFVLYTGDAAYAHDSTPQETGRGIKDWVMTYPYDQRYQSVTQKFSDTLTSDFMIRKDPGSASTFGAPVPYKALSMEIGHSGSSGVFRRVCAENDTNFTVGHTGLTTSEFIKVFYGIGDGKSNIDNQHVTFRRGVTGLSQSVVIRGWRHGMMSGFPLRPRAVYRRDHYGQPRDLLEQRLDAKFFDELGLSPDGTSNGVVGVKTGPVQVYFYDNAHKQTDALKTLSSNVSFEATSSTPYFDGTFRNRPAYDFSTLNIKSVII